VLVLSAVACGSDSGVSTDRADADSAAPSVTSGATGAPTTDAPGTDEPTTDAPGTDAPSTDAPSTDASTPGPNVGTLDWQDYDADGTTQTATLEVPVDYDDPDGPTFELFVTRHLAEDQANKIGSLLVNPGGPGFGGSEFGLYAYQIYGQPLLDNFDIVGWDPRGTNDSTPVTCFGAKDTDAFTELDSSPDDAVETDALIIGTYEFAKSCWQHSGDLLEHISTVDTVRDLDLMRALVGDQKLSYLGYSYGTQIGAVYADLFPQRTGRLVLDAAVDKILASLRAD
jgi:pimeloyl-ACP methyl ester carboxylesterase